MHLALEPISDPESSGSLVRGWLLEGAVRNNGNFTAEILRCKSTSSLMAVSRTANQKLEQD